MVIITRKHAVIGQSVLNAIAIIMKKRGSGAEERQSAVFFNSCLLDKREYGSFTWWLYHHDGYGGTSLGNDPNVYAIIGLYRYYKHQSSKPYWEYIQNFSNSQ